MADKGILLTVSLESSGRAGVAFTEIGEAFLVQLPKKRQHDFAEEFSNILKRAVYDLCNLAAPASPGIEQEIADFEKWADANGYRNDGYVREWMVKAWLARAQQGKP